MQKQVSFDQALKTAWLMKGTQFLYYSHMLIRRCHLDLQRDETHTSTDIARSLPLDLCWKVHIATR